MTADSPAASPSEVRKGLEGVVAGETSVSEVDGQNCRLIYRGYDIGELAGKASYEEVSHLLLTGKLPTRAQLADWTAQLDRSCALEPQVSTLLQALPRQADPMLVLRSAMSVQGLYDPDGASEAVEGIRRAAGRAIAKTTTLVAATWRLHEGQSPVSPKPGLGHAANFLYMLHGTEPTRGQAAALDQYFVLLAEHGFNASTFTARTVTGTKSDYYSAIVAALGSLNGPLHGAAGRKAMETLIEIGSADRVEPFVKQTLANHQRFMGFGHRVYKGDDPRGRFLKALSKQLGEASREPKWYEISERLQAAVWQAKQLHINVDFYSASLLHYLGIPTELFTTMFACARMAGWSAHIIEQHLDNRLIRPLARYVGPYDLRFVPVEQRAG